MKKVKFIKYKPNLCFKCLKEKNNINTYSLKYRGYGSIFDGFDSILNLCDECNDKELDKWFNEEPTMNDHIEKYKYESNIENFINILPIQGRELFKNQCSDENIESQDWIDIELNIAPDEVYKKYRMYSPSEENAYHDRFPTCKNVYLKTYKDGSAMTMCDYMAYGEKDGSCSKCISSKCYYCKLYEKKDKNDKLIEKKELYITKNDLKEVKMFEWTCPKCGEIVHSYTYEEYFTCSNCGKTFELYDD